MLRLPSGEMRRVLLTCRATVGEVGNSDHANESSGKAGRSRWLGKRPSVRGTAMNPVDHPHGGGEGMSKGHHPVTPWGVALPVPAPCEVHYGEPMRFEGSGDEDDVVIKGYVEQVKSRIAALVDTARRARRERLKPGGGR